MLGFLGKTEKLFTELYMILYYENYSLPCSNWTLRVSQGILFSRIVKWAQCYCRKMLRTVIPLDAFAGLHSIKVTISNNKFNKEFILYRYMVFVLSLKTFSRWKLPCSCYRLVRGDLARQKTVYVGQKF